jgi:hypothetical protein
MVRNVVRNGVEYEVKFLQGDVEERGKDGSFSAWGLNHYLRVKAARDKEVTIRPEPSARELQHPLVGKTLWSRETGTAYRVEKVKENWWRGKFLMALLANESQSHRQCMVENLSCVDPSIVEQIAQFSNTFTLEPAPQAQNL